MEPASRGSLASIDNTDGAGKPAGRRVLSELTRYTHEYKPPRSFPIRKVQQPVADESTQPVANLSEQLSFSVEGGREVAFNVHDQLQANARKQEEKELDAVFHRMDRDGNGRVDLRDLRGTMEVLAHEASATEVDNMLWEVDDDAVGYLTLQEFKKMYYRIRASALKDEPRELFRLIEFMMIDMDGSGHVDMDEASTIFRRRYGKRAVVGVIAIFEERARRIARGGGAPQHGSDADPGSSEMVGTSSSAISTAALSVSGRELPPLTAKDVAFLGGGTQFVTISYTEYVELSGLLELAKHTC